MNYLKSITTTFIVGIAFAACNNNTSDKSGSMSAADSSQNAMMEDSAASKTNDSLMNMKDTSMGAMKDTSKAGKSTVKKKKLKASIGEIAPSLGKKYTKNSMGVYDNAEVMPSFKGGPDAIDNYVNTNLNASQAAIDDAKEGKIPVMFTVDETGKVMNAHTMGKKLGDGLDEEAVRVVSSMPKWQPGTIQGKPVKVSLTLPIVFKTEE